MRGITLSGHNLSGAFLRLISIGGKFLLVMYLARYFSMVELGIFGLFAGTAAILVQVLGLEFYTYATREMLKRPPSAWPGVVSSQRRLYFLAYALVPAMVAAVYLLGVLPLTLMPWFMLVLIGTHLSTEMHRLLVALSRPKAAYWLSAIGQGLWVFPVVLLGWMFPACRTLHLVFGGWAVAVLLSVAIGAWYLGSMGLLRASPAEEDWRFVREGLRVCWIFLLNSVCFQLMDSADRYFIQHAMGEGAVGVFTFYSSIARACREMIFAGFVVVAFPRLVSSIQGGDPAAARRDYENMVRATLKGIFVFVPLFAVGIWPVLWILRRPEFSAQIGVYPWLLAGAVAASLAMIPHYTLYAGRQDYAILATHLGGLVLYLSLNTLLVPSWGLTGAAVASSLSFVALGLMKYGFSRRP